MREVIIEVVATIIGYALVLSILMGSLWLCAMSVNLFVGLFV